MSIAHTLTDGSSTVTIYPKWNYKRTTTMNRSDHRMIDQGLVSYKWHAYHVFAFGLDFVSAADMAQINAWWEAGTSLTYEITRDGSTESHTVKIVGETTPLDQMQYPHTDYYRGEISLEATAAA